MTECHFYSIHVPTLIWRHKQGADTEVAKESILAGHRVREREYGEDRRHSGVLTIDMLLFQNTPDDLAQALLLVLLPEAYMLNTALLITPE